MIVIWRDKGVTGKAFADTEEEAAQFREEMKAKGLRVTVRRTYEWFKGERFRKPGSVIRMSWGP